METTQSTPPRPDDNRCKAISKLIEAVAEQQEALARILEAEHKKIEKATQLYGADIEDLLESPQRGRFWSECRDSLHSDSKEESESECCRRPAGGKQLSTGQLH